MDEPAFLGAASRVAAEYSAANGPWIIGFSGGKDSSLVVKLVFSALSDISVPSTAIHIVYCDTGVEIPIIARTMNETLQRLETDARNQGLPISCTVATPSLRDRYFTKVIGRGYPPPTNKFRWCTDRLRIEPVKRKLKELSDEGSVVLLGSRFEESPTRDKTLAKYSTKSRYHFYQSGGSGHILYCPIVDLTANDVWEGLLSLPFPKAIDGESLARLYKGAGGECPIIREPTGPPCSSGRFGCWTCTVVRRDRATENLVSDGHKELRPLLQFRNWLIQVRDMPEFRCSRRRNGASGLGPFRLSARRTILDNLLYAQEQSGLHLITQDELEYIYHLWDTDRQSPDYRED